MNDTAAHLVDRVIPRVAVRQWVLSLPFRLRYLCAKDPALLRAVLRIFVQTVYRCVRRLCRRAGGPSGRCGSVTAVQRFASSLGLNVHLHALVLDGVYRREEGADAPVFHEAPALRDTDVARVVAQVRRRVTALLEKRGLGGRDFADPAPEDEGLFARLCAASVAGQIALGPKAGWRVARVGGAPVLLAPSARGLCAEADGYNVQAAVRIDEADRSGLERLCRYILRPPLARDRLSEAPEGRLFYELKRAWSDGTTHLCFTPQGLIERLCALVPPPRSHLVLYHGVLSSHAAWRREVIPEPVVLWVPPWERDPAQPAESATEDTPRAPRSRRLSWGALLKRIFGLDVLRCSRCGGRRKVVAFVTDPAELRRICEALGVPHEAPPLHPARSPPQAEIDFLDPA
jgi:hypothetical protein